MRREKPIIVALDVPTRKEAENLVEELIEYVEIYKVGHQLFLQEGFDVVHMIQDRGGKVFLDLKFHDIPSVISEAVEIVVKEDVYMLTLHSLGGRRMLTETVKKVKEVCTDCKSDLPLLLGVTILTSLDEEDLQEMGFSLSVDETVFKLATICRECGLDGVVCAGSEIQKIREKFQWNFVIVTPGVRLRRLPSDDQRRIATACEAIRWGADYLVMGRRITASKKPKTEIELILEEIQRL